MGEWTKIDALEQEIMKSSIREMNSILRRELEPLLNAAEAVVTYSGPVNELRKAVERWK